MHIAGINWQLLGRLTTLNVILGGKQVPLSISAFQVVQPMAGDAGEGCRVPRGSPLSSALFS